MYFSVSIDCIRRYDTSIQYFLIMILQDIDCYSFGRWLHVSIYHVFVGVTPAHPSNVLNRLSQILPQQRQGLEVGTQAFHLGSRVILLLRIHTLKPNWS